jgi:dTDP-4-amino-4,6-dideoxygalactose transaminase
MKVPFLDLKAHHDPIRAEVMAAMEAVIDKNAFAGGPFVADFENDFAPYCGAKHALGVGNGTDALWIALLAQGIGCGDEVITVPMTFMATAEAITYTGATPVFVDIHETSYTMDPAQVEAVITPRTKAIIPVHLFGQCADMDPILAIARKHNLVVIEDAAQAQGAGYRSSKLEAGSSGDTDSQATSGEAIRRAGSMGEVGCFSFYPGKNLGAWGEAGATTTNSTELHQRMAMYREHGQSKKYHHDVVGWNLRMDGLQGAVLKVKLKYLDKANDGRRRAAAQYSEMLKDVSALTLPQEMPYAHHIWHIYPVRVANRDSLMQRLGERGVATGIHYPVLVHLTKAYESMGLKKGTFPVSEACGEEFMSLPMYPELTEDQVSYVVESLKAEV